MVLPLFPLALPVLAAARAALTAVAAEGPRLAAGAPLVGAIGLAAATAAGAAADRPVARGSLHGGPVRGVKVYRLTSQQKLHFN